MEKSINNTSPSPKSLKLRKIVRNMYNERYPEFIIHRRILNDTDCTEDEKYRLIKELGMKFDRETSSIRITADASTAVRSKNQNDTDSYS